MTNNKNGFTLIELLVVVLIIGILASVALPQYQKAVAKSRATQGLALLRPVVEAAESYHLANGVYPTSFSELDISLPGDWSGNKKIYKTENKDAKSNGTWSIAIQKPAEGASGVNGIHIGLITGPYQGAGFAYVFNQYSTVPQQEFLCSEYVDSDAPFQKEKGAFCSKIFSGVVVYDNSSHERYYRMNK